MRTNDYLEERVARFVELAEAAQDAAGRTSDMVLKVQYASLASHWVQLAQMAIGMVELSRKMSAPIPGDEHRRSEFDLQN